MRELLRKRRQCGPKKGPVVREGRKGVDVAPLPGSQIKRHCHGFVEPQLVSIY